MSKTKVAPMSKTMIRNYAMKIRSLLGYGKKDYVDAPKLFDSLSIVFDNVGFSFDYKVLPDNDKIFEKEEEACTDIFSGIIYIKESVMEQACSQKYKRGVFTLIHELAHYLLHYIQNDTRLARVADDVYVPIYCDPEWQADTFTSEFLMPYEECVNMNEEEIRQTYHVSKKAAEVRYNKIQKEKNK